MKFQDIPDMIEVTRRMITPNAISIWYNFNGEQKLLIVMKTDSDPHWRLMEGKASQHRALLVAIKEEQRLFSASAENTRGLNMVMLGNTGTAFFSPLHR
jgi:hypothetical protein